MGLFKKKSDPISERARELNDKIAELEAQIKRLATQQPEEPREETVRPTPQPAAATPQPALAPLPDPAPVPQPRLRPATLPRSAPHPTREVFLEQPDQQRLKERTETATPPPRPELGTAKSDVGSVWRRFKNNFRGPPTSNPKLVSYLAAGSIQGLRPLRYEKRVARNRFIVLSGILILLLWGVVAIFLRHR
jgi:hypothetical protein